ncbi:hypothetical protein MSG28_001551 [Choristoneura fumiferana]|uniref:Uncharacterized protein n=1 Tax=Choristoneura fumiferana TaxID=7141 RepID=A0ACC0KV13_CHOFU|nr:hypothetical protein MSG28_001551 [Choristoneura fumiferana]
MYEDEINKGTKKSRKIMVIKPSKYETAEALQVSKKYWKNVMEQMDSTVVNKEAAKMQEKEQESAYLSQVLPEALYKKVCLTLDLPIKNCEEEKVDMIEEKKFNRVQKDPLLSFRKTIHIDREMDSDTDVELSPREASEGVNVHQELLSKPEREQITWPTHYLEPEKEEEKTLVRKADDLTDRIVQEFCEYMKQLGGDQQSQLFNPKAIKELFQVGFQYFYNAP